MLNNKVQDQTAGEIQQQTVELTSSAPVEETQTTDNTKQEPAEPIPSATVESQPRGEDASSKSSSEEHKSLVEKMKKHSTGQKVATIIKWILIGVLMGFGIWFYTSRYLDPDVNASTNTETQKMNEIPVPHILLKFQCYNGGCWEPIRLYYPNNVANLSNCSMNAMTSIPTRQDLRNQGDETLCFFYNYQNIYYMAIVPPKSANLPINYDDYMTLALNFRRYTDSLKYYDISESGLYYAARVWVFNRKTFIEKGVTDTGLNAPLMITPAKVYETTLKVTLKIRIWGWYIDSRRTRDKRLKYELSFDGIASNTWCYEKAPLNLSSSDLNDCLTLIYINPPFDNSITKIIKAKEYDFWDILSSIGGLYSLGAAIMVFCCGRIIWGIKGFSITWFLGCCPYAQPDDYIMKRQIKNMWLKDRVAFENEEEKKKLLLPEHKSRKFCPCSFSRQETDLKHSMNSELNDNEEDDCLIQVENTTSKE